MVTLVNRAKVATATTGTGTITLGAAESGYQAFADAGVVNSDVVRYTIEDGDAWEIGTGTYSAGTLTRVLDESSTGSLLNLTGNAVVFVSATEADLREQRVGTISVSQGSGYENVDFDLSTGTIFNRTLSADTYADFVNPPASGAGYEFLLKITGGNAVVGYDLSAASYDSTSFSVGGQELTPNGLSFSPDGYKLFVVGSGTDNVYEYDLWVSFELSTASYSGVSFSVGGQDSTPTGIAFSLDGTKMYIVGSKNDRVHQYTLSTSFDLSTASYDSVSLLVQSQDSSPAGLSFSPDGYKMFMVGASTDTVYEYDLFPSFDLSSAVYSNNSFSVGGQATSPTGVSFSADGTKMFVTGNINDTVYQYTLSSGFSLSTASYDGVSFSVVGQDTVPQGIIFSADGAKMFMVGSTTDTVYQYTTGSNSVAGLFLPASVTWLDGVAPTNYPPVGSTLALQFFTTDGGVTYYGSKLGSPALATVATTGAYSDLSGLPTLGTAAATDATAYATAAQGSLADSAVQPADNISTLTNDAGYITSADGGNADLLDGQHGAYYLDYTNFLNTPTIPAAYTNTDVDTHLNTGTAASGEVLSWNGSDYDWITSGGAFSVVGTNNLAAITTLPSITTGANNFVAGNSANSLSTGSSNVSFAGGLGSITTGTGNFAYRGLFNLTTASNNIALGAAAGNQITTSPDNIIIGTNALRDGNGGSGYHVVLGNFAGQSIAGGALRNVAIGEESVKNSNGAYNIGIGYNATSGAGAGTFTGAHNIGAGEYPLLSLTSGSYNIALGSRSGFDLSTGSNNFLGGYQAGTNLTTGSNNVALGLSAGSGVTTSSYNVHIGQYAGSGVTTSSNTIFVGREAGRYASNGIGIGYRAARYSTQGTNIGIGSQSLYGGSLTGGNNVGLGNGTLQSVETGFNNTAIGSDAGVDVSTGQQNTLLGSQAGNSGVNDLTTGSNNTLLGYNATASSATVSNEITLGDSSITTLRCQVTTITSLSDARDKTDIQPLNAGLEFVEALNPVSFTWDMRDGGKVGEADTGFIAQDLKQAQEDLGVHIPHLVFDANPDKLEAGYGKLIPVLVQAIKDLSAKVNELEARLEDK